MELIYRVIVPQQNAQDSTSVPVSLQVHLFIPFLSQQFGNLSFIIQGKVYLFLCLSIYTTDKCDYLLFLFLPLI